MTKRALVIGGSGFVGGHLVPALLHDQFHVSVLNRGHKVTGGAEQLTADRTDGDQLFQIAQQVPGFDVVFDTSSYNFQSTKTAWDAFSGVTQRWIHLSSAAVYKETPGRCPAEGDPIGGAAIWADYGFEKAAADAFLTDQAERLPVTIFRPPYLYGPGNDNDRESFIWARCLQGRPVIIPKNGETRIQFLHAEDLADIMVHASTSEARGAQVFNVASEERMSLREWVNLVATAAGFADPGILAGDQADDYMPRQYFPFRDYPCCVDVQFLMKSFEWRPRLGLFDGFRQTFETQDIQHLASKPLDSETEQTILARIQSCDLTHL
ncbi:NAD-dependent epimerase/dehydratase family protein [Mesorhizobium sp. M1D.F.Ca.ET.043.01.1.1]|uniref:NAD-dependent epimerase/dehydratase family protein n=3 Tax=unclassified Mesorhizobium TaxID=325217 RepID=UPI000F76002B|nr:NAD-dependent epimerase/dehydratase family protein [Mesorhizobium sp. M1D.F.Ca.ET.043.01.1.1]AZO75558.1 NAD-dependent epimerase/dehydratase family protein [Mesorhizobium sp. M1D.F.Ca.ET.043.01.1.1]